MTELKLTVPEVGEKNTVADPRTQVAFEAIRSFINTEQLSSGNIKEHGIEESRLSEAVQSQIGAKIAGLAFTIQNGSYVAASGELVFQEKEGATVTLPGAVKNAIVGVFAGASGVKVKAGSATIFGDFVEGAAEVVLQKSQHVTLQCNGTHWDIIAGEPKREQTYVAKEFTKAEAEAGVEPSPTRPAMVSLTCTTAKTGSHIIVVGGQSAGVAPYEEIGTATVYVPPGQKWVMGQTVRAYTILL
jgi:hypothetical protein